MIMSVLIDVKPITNLESNTKIISDPDKIKNCGCTSKTYCLRLHCDCFKNGEFCGIYCSCI